MNELALGIDTGGTYTDGVLLDVHNRAVVSTTKTLTTRHDLTIGILHALDNLLPEDATSIKLVAISTTLATNAIVEGKRKPAALFLLGYDPDLIRRFHFETRFATPRFTYFRGGHTLEGQEQAELDLDGISERARAIADEVEAFAVSGYFSPFNTSHEEQAYETITELTKRPVVLGHQLSSKLDSVQRATTASLNASLLSILQEFIAAMQQALRERGVDAPLMVVRGDGALMSADIASQRPVETVHSGPAASAIGARFLSNQEHALVIDIGGTTTDIAILERGNVSVREDGTSVGEHQTAVRAANIRSIGLGGDSYISFDLEDHLHVGPARVTPISYLAHAYPDVGHDLQALGSRIARRPTPDHVEYWFLQREPRRFIQNERARQVLDLLRDGPLSLPQILERTGLFHALQFDGKTLIQEEIVGRAALTPTDLFHLTGDYAPWDAESARRAAEHIARLRGWPVEKLIQKTLAHISERIATEIISFITRQSLERVPEYVPYDNLGLWLFEESLHRRSPHLGSRIFLKMPIVGIGAPAGILLPKVAEILETELLLPEHHEVANAVGAVAGSVMVSQEAWIFPQLKGVNVVGYIAQAGGEQQRFSRLEEAVSYARETIGERALAQARLAGALDPLLEVEQLSDGAESYRIRARAIGNPDLSAPTPA